MEKLHPSNKTLQTIMFCWRRHSELQTWIISGRFCCWRFARFQTNLRRSVMRIWTTNFGSDFLDVREATSRVPERCLLRNNFFARRFENGRYYQLCNCVIVFRKTFSNPDAKEKTFRAQAASVLLFLIMLIICSSDSVDPVPRNNPASSFPARLYTTKQV